MPILIDTIIQRYRFRHPYVQFLKFRLGRIWAQTRREDFPTFHYLFDFNLCFLSEQDFNDLLLIVFADIVNTPTYLQRHTLYICPGCLCFVRPNSHSCVTMCCARPMHHQCYRTDPCTACLIHLNEQLFCIRGWRSLNHTPTASFNCPFHPVYYPSNEPRNFYGRYRVGARPWFNAVRTAPIFFNWFFIVAQVVIFAALPLFSVWYHPCYVFQYNKINVGF